MSGPGRARPPIGLPIRLLAVAALAALVLAAGAPAGAQGRKDGSTPAAGAAEEATHQVTINNKTPARIRTVNISSSRADDWGKDLLGSDELDPGGKATVTYVGPCRADVEIDFEGGAIESRRFVDVCRFPSLTIEAGWTLKPMGAE